MKALHLTDRYIEKLRNRNYRVSRKTSPKVHTCNETGELFFWEIIYLKVPLKEYQDN